MSRSTNPTFRSYNRFARTSSAVSLSLFLALSGSVSTYSSSTIDPRVQLYRLRGELRYPRDRIHRRSIRLCPRVLNNLRVVKRIRSRRKRKGSSVCVCVCVRFFDVRDTSVPFQLKSKPGIDVEFHLVFIGLQRTECRLRS